MYITWPWQLFSTWTCCTSGWKTGLQELFWNAHGNGKSICGVFVCFTRAFRGFSIKQGFHLPLWDFNIYRTLGTHQVRSPMDFPFFFRSVPPFCRRTSAGSSKRWSPWSRIWWQRVSIPSPRKSSWPFSRSRDKPSRRLAFCLCGSWEWRSGRGRLGKIGEFKGRL